MDGDRHCPGIARSGVPGPHVRLRVASRLPWYRRPLRTGHGPAVGQHEFLVMSRAPHTSRRSPRSSRTERVGQRQLTLWHGPKRSPLPMVGVRTGKGGPKSPHDGMLTGCWDSVVPTPRSVRTMPRHPRSFHPERRRTFPPRYHGKAVNDSLLWSHRIERRRRCPTLNIQLMPVSVCAAPFGLGS
jgi:hypothetical protein